MTTRIGRGWKQEPGTSYRGGRDSNTCALTWFPDGLAGSWVQNWTWDLMLTIPIWDVGFHSSSFICSGTTPLSQEFLLWLLWYLSANFVMFIKILFCLIIRIYYAEKGNWDIQVLGLVFHSPWTACRVDTLIGSWKQKVHLKYFCTRFCWVLPNAHCMLLALWQSTRIMFHEIWRWKVRSRKTMTDSREIL